MMNLMRVFGWKLIRIGELSEKNPLLIPLGNIPYWLSNILQVSLNAAFLYLKEIPIHSADDH